MKKLLLAAAVALAFGASAETTAVHLPGNLTTITGQPTDGGLYLIYDHSKPSSVTNNDSDRRAMRYALSDGSSTEIKGNVNLNASSTDNVDYNQYVWVAEKVVEDNNTYWKFKHAGTGKYIAAAPDEQKPLNIDATAGLYSLTYSSDGEGFKVVSSVSTQAWDGDHPNYNARMVTWGGQGGNANAYHYYQFFEVTEDMIVRTYNVTVNYVKGGKTYFTENLLVQGGNTLNLSLPAGLVDYDNSPINEDKTVNVTIAENVTPFKLTSVKEDNKWATTTAIANYITTNANSFANAEWLLEVKTGDFFKLYSLAKKMYLGPVPTNENEGVASVAFNNDNPGVFKVTRTPYGPEEICNSTTTSTSTREYFNLRTGIGSWSAANDAGSHWFMVYDETVFAASRPCYPAASTSFPLLTGSFYTKVNEITEFYHSVSNIESPYVATLATELAKADGLRFGRDNVAAYLVTLQNAKNDVVEHVIPKTISYRLYSDVLDEYYTGSYEAYWNGDDTSEPELAGLSTATLTDKVFTRSGTGTEVTYTLAANITFPFPVSGETVENPTYIESDLGHGRWFVDDANIARSTRASHVTLTYSNQGKYIWYIYPFYNDGVFSFKIKNNGGKYMPAFSGSQAGNTTNEVVDEAEAGSFYFKTCTNNQDGTQGYGFAISNEGTVFLSINAEAEDDQPVWTWNKNSAHRGSNLHFPNITHVTIEDDQQQLATLAAAPRLDILEGSTVVGPNELAAPVLINAAIDAANAVDKTDIEAIDVFITGSQAATINDYLTKLEQYHGLFTCKLEITKQYSTLMLPCRFGVPDGMIVSKIVSSGTASAHTNGTINHSTTTAFEENVPYVIEAAVGNKYTFIGWNKDHPQNTYTHGWLTGVYHEGGMDVPVGSYYLDVHNNRQAFVKHTGVQASEVSLFAAPAKNPRVNQYECYLTPAEGEEDRPAYYFVNVGTAISEVAVDATDDGAIYDLQGRRLAAPVKGINIIGGRKVLIK